MKIFVLHYSKLVDRKKSIINQFEKNNITDYEFIEKYDINEITPSDSSMFDINYKKSTMSLILKHFYAYNEIANNTYDDALIFEDDAILCDNFIDKLNKYIEQLPKDYDMLFIGDGCNLHIEQNKIIPNKNIYEKCLYPTRWGGNGCSRCTDSYLISKKCAINLCEYINKIIKINKIKEAADFFINDAARDNNFKVYWAEPTIVKQGSQNNSFKSSISCDRK
jgi:GR25 family glycosyltransferase involved in LPS biosynthesis